MAIPRDPYRSVGLGNLGFLEDPFRWAPDPRFLYLSSQHRPIMNQLHRAIESERCLAFIEGERGVGKSVIARRLESYYGARPNEYRVSFIHQPNFDSYYSTLLGLSKSFVLKRRKGIPNQRAELEKFLSAEIGMGKVVLFILDDVGNQFNREVFEELDWVSREYAPVVIFGGPEISKILHRIPDVLERTSRATLLPFSLDDAVEFIEFRVMVAGRKTPMFAKDAIEYIWESTKGNPKDMVVVCGRAINELGARDEDFVTMDIAEVAVESYLSSPLVAIEPVTEIIQSAASPEAETLEETPSNEYA